MRSFMMIIISVLFLRLTVAQTPDEIKDKLPKIEWWYVNEDVEVFGPDNLYNRINGAAPGFILFNFKELTVFEYNYSLQIEMENPPEPPYITIQVYRHATADDAFGIYASERPSQTNFLTVGTEGYQEGSMLNFFVDNLYVKIESPSIGESIEKDIRQIAHEFAQNVNSQSLFPKVLQKFPVENKIAHSELYIPVGYLGHDFLNNAFTANYELSGKKYQLFIIDAETAEQAKAILSKYLQFSKQKIKLREGRLTINDRFNGNVECQWKGKYIWGIVNESKVPVKVDDILNETEKILLM